MAGDPMFEITPDEQALLDGEREASATAGATTAGPGPNTRGETVEAEPAESRGGARAKPAAAAVVETPDPAAVAAAAAKPGTAAADAEAEDPEEAEADAKLRGPDGKFLPQHAALVQERTRRKALAKQLKELNTKREADALERARLDERLTILNNYIAEANKPKAEPKRAIDPVTQPAEAIAALSQDLTALRTSIDTDNDHTRFVGTVKNHTAAFAQRVPDYEDAYRFMKDFRAKQLRAEGYSEAEIPGIINQDEYRVANTALQRKRDPAELIYEMAKVSGYTPRAAASVAAAAAAGGQQQQQQPAKGGQQPTAAERLATQARGAEASASLAQATGRTMQPLSLEQIGNMSEDELMKFGGDLVGTVRSLENA